MHVRTLTDGLSYFKRIICCRSKIWYSRPWKVDVGVRLRLKCDGTRAGTRFCLSAKRTSPFKSAGASFQSITGNRGVLISDSNAGYTMFRGSEGYWLPTPFASYPFTSPPVRHRVPSHFNWFYKLPGPGGPEGGPDYFAYVIFSACNIIIWWLYRSVMGKLFFRSGPKKIFGGP